MAFAIRVLWLITFVSFAAMKARGEDELLKPAKPASAAPAEEAVKSDPPRDTFIVLPLHIHLLHCKTEEDLDCKLTDDDVHRVLGKVNGVWHRGGIHWRLASLAHEEAGNVETFAEAKAKAKAHEMPVPLEAFAGTAPPDTRKLPGLHVYYIHQFAVNGVYLGHVTCFVKDTAALRKVEGGIDEPLPRVTSHELGHALGLPHRQDTFNLMASGTTGTLFNKAEVEIARTRAKGVAGALTVAECETIVAGKDRAPAAEADVKSIKDALDALPKP